MTEQKAPRVSAVPPVDAKDKLPGELWQMIVKYQRAHSTFLRLCTTTRDIVIAEIRKQHKLTTEQARIFAKVVLSGQSLFLTGAGGCGKSHVLRAITQHLCRSGNRGRVALGAPTGAAARVASSSHLHACTLHKYFNIQSRQRDPLTSKAALDERSTQELELAAVNVDAEFEACEAERVRGLPTAIINKDVKERLQTLDLFVLDEVSMVSADMLELVSAAFQLARENQRPFGGVQLILTGDPWQLAPVQTTGTMRWFFQSELWTFPTTELKQQVRQRNDAAFGAILARIRTGTHTPADLRWINTHACKDPQRVPLLTLCPYNRLCDRINDERVAAMPGPHRSFVPEYSVVELIESRPFWRTRPYVARQKVTPPGTHSSKPLRLALHTRVRSLRNVYREPRGIHDLVIANGQRGVVVRLEHDSVAVRWEPVGDERPITTMVRPTATMRRQSFTSARGLPVYAVSHQLALKPSFAITLHASQGGSFRGPTDIDVTSREPPAGGQGPWIAKPAAAYVALSRIDQVASIRLTVPLRADHVRTDDQVAAWAAAGYPCANTAPSP